MVRRVVWDHEAADSISASPTKIDGLSSETRCRNIVVKNLEYYVVRFEAVRSAH